MEKMMTEKNTKRRRFAVAAAIAAALSALLFVLVACGKTQPSETTENGGKETPVISGKYMSLSGISVDGSGFAYISDATRNAVYKIDGDGKTVATYVADGSVNNVVSDGDKVYALVGGLGGKLVVLSSELKEEGSITVGHTPTDIIVIGNKAYVSNRFSSSVAVVSLTENKKISEIPVMREPMALALSGTDIYVACHLPDDAATDDSVSASVSVIDTTSDKLSKNISLVNGAGNVKDIVTSTDGNTVYVSHIVSRYQYPTTQLDAGWVNTNAISVIDTASKEVSYTFLLDDVDHGAPNPWGLAVSDDGSKLYCALAGTDELVRVDIAKLNSAVSKLGKKNSDLPISSKEEIVNYIPFAKDAKTRLALDGKGARAIDVSNGKVYVAEYYSGTVKVVDESEFGVVATLKAEEQPESDEVRAGEIYWNDASICYQNWQSCASCHPDARSGGFNWDELGDGIGTSKQTKSMLYVMRTPPCLATGLEENGEHGVSGSVSGTPLWNDNIDSEAISNAMIAYLRTLEPVASPYLNDDGSLTDSAKHGKELFESYGCAVCHPAPLYTDLKLHETPTLEFDDSWENREMDTPTLVEVWRTSPWTYIGKFTDMEETVKYFVTKSGKTISDTDAADLAEFILSIGSEGEIYGVEQVTNSDDTYNKLVAGKQLKSVSVIGQSDDCGKVTVKVELFDNGGNLIGESSATVEKAARAERVTAILTTPIDVGENAAYCIVSITDGSGNAAATPLKITK